MAKITNEELIDDLSYMKPYGRWSLPPYKCAFCGKEVPDSGTCIGQRDEEGYEYWFYFCGQCPDSIEFTNRVEQNVEEHK